MKTQKKSIIVRDLILMIISMMFCIIGMFIIEQYQHHKITVLTEQLAQVSQQSVDK